tara:strand:+ start:366 stop:566 length:201 start_codon:yes stop_codon:yes gene_type:complete
MSHAQKLRQLLSGHGIIKVPGVYDGLTARLVDQAGFNTAFVSGAGIAFAVLQERHFQTSTSCKHCT